LKFTDLENVFTKMKNKPLIRLGLRWCRLKKDSLFLLRIIDEKIQVQNTEVKCLTHKRKTLLFVPFQVKYQLVMSNV